MWFKRWLHYLFVRKTLRRAVSISWEQEFTHVLHILEPILNSDELLVDARIWKWTWKAFGKIMAVFGEEALGKESLLIANAPENVAKLYRFGYALVEIGLYKAATAILERGFRIAPDNEDILTELAHVFEITGRHDLARERLLKAPHLLTSSFMPRYLITFCSLMMGDLEAAEKWFAGLHALLANVPKDAQEISSHVYANITSMLARARKISNVTALDKRDLRGWNAVINGNIVLHLNDEEEETMGGRYAWIQEGPFLLFQCIEQLKAVLALLKEQPQRILSLPDRDSQILAHVVSTALACSVEVLSEQTQALPGLIACYHTKSLTEEVIDLLSTAETDQIFWCHVADWTQDSIAPDIISYFAQYVSPAWGKQFSVDTEEGQWEAGKQPKIVEKSALEGSYEEIAHKLQSMTGPLEIQHDPSIPLLVEQLFCINRDPETNPFRKERRRAKQWSDSPVVGSSLR